LEDETVKGRENQANTVSSVHQTSSNIPKGKTDNKLESEV
jgi:hypothetical protein